MMMYQIELKKKKNRRKKKVAKVVCYDTRRFPSIKRALKKRKKSIARLIMKLNASDLCGLNRLKERKSFLL